MGRAQGALEYLLLIGGAILVAVIVVSVLSGIGGGGGTEARKVAADALCAKYGNQVLCNGRQVQLQGETVTCIWKSTGGVCRANLVEISVPVALQANSAGSGSELIPPQAAYAQIYVNGVQRANNTRGLNIVVVNETTGAYINDDTFDTYDASCSALVPLTNFINSISAGRIVLMAARDEWARDFKQTGGCPVAQRDAAYTALESIHADTLVNIPDFPFSPPWDAGNCDYASSYAMISVKGSGLYTEQYSQNRNNCSGVPVTVSYTP